MREKRERKTVESVTVDIDKALVKGGVGVGVGIK